MSERKTNRMEFSCAFSLTDTLMETGTELDRYCEFVVQNLRKQASSHIVELMQNSDLSYCKISDSIGRANGGRVQVVVTLEYQIQC